MNETIQPAQLSLVPFLTMLLCIALLPAILKHDWEKNYHRIALILAAITSGYYLFGLHHPERVLHAASDYISFIAFVGSLFVIASGIHIDVRGEAKPIRIAANSMGAVFFGATTYIGNSPNFMVKAITEREGVHAPSFWGFIFKFALPVLLPVLYLVGWFSFRH
jgi:Na+/H+ antiporter NhaD/arsenite permease-like protein